MASFRYWDSILKPGKWADVQWPPKREKSRRLNPGWLDALMAAKRILHVASRWTKNDNGAPALAFFVRHDVWTLLQNRLSWPAVEAEPWKQHNPDALELARAERFERTLADPATRLAFKRLPVGFRMTKELEELSSECGPLFLERAKAYLRRDYERLGLSARERYRALDEELNANRLPTPKEITVKAFVESFLNKIRYN